ncbi:hypothetical protein AGMMS50229_20170 [Campylobacterota bacterium]|nr:hypothetical protein AGMMS50229_20170 [Campylobacterota bacterium]
MNVKKVCYLRIVISALKNRLRNHNGMSDDFLGRRQIEGKKQAKPHYICPLAIYSPDADREKGSLLR